MKKIGFPLMVLASCLVSGCSLSIFPQLNLPTKKAEVDFVSQAVEVEPRNEHAWFMIGKEHLRSSQPQEARAAFKEALALRPDFHEALIGIGKSHLQEQNWSDAAEAFERVLSISPKSLGGREGLAEAHFGAGNLAKARVAAGEALALNKDSFTANLVMGKVEYMERDYQAALEHWQRADLSGELPLDIVPVMNDLRQFLTKYGEAKQLDGAPTRAGE